MKNKHLTFEERCIIEEYLNKGESVHKIAQKLERPDSSIVREILRNRYLSFKPDQEYCQFRFEDRCLKQFNVEDCMPEGGTCRRTLCRGCEIMCNKELGSMIISLVLMKLYTPSGLYSAILQICPSRFFLYILFL